MKKHILYYISLFLLLTCGFYGALYFKSQKTTQLALIVGTTVIYVFWGVIHHLMHHSFSIKIMLEYVAVGILGISLILFFFNIAL